MSICGVRRQEDDKAEGRNPIVKTKSGASEGWQGWDEYAPFYDWENAQTLGRRDVAFWRSLTRRESAKGSVLELGCGTGRLLIPLARSGARMVGLDRSESMLEHGRARIRRLPRARRPPVLRGDIRSLPFKRGSFGLVMAPYGMLQSLLSDADLRATLREAARVLRRGGVLGVDLVPDLRSWAEYGPRIRMRGRATTGAHVTLVESVRQDRRRHLTVFDEQFVERRGAQTRKRRFSLTFRTLPMPQMVSRIEEAGFRIEALLGDYRGAPWDARADTWIVVARKR
jgi:ubiquinone/menaquinone biosynthesis C-methylase UbiE